jgi:hypothetical protein
MREKMERLLKEKEEQIEVLSKQIEKGTLLFSFSFFYLLLLTY